MRNFFIDTEFIDTGVDLHLVSIALVCDNGSEYYAESSEYDPLLADDWVKANVLNKLEGNPKPLKQIGHEIRYFVEKHTEDYGRAAFWGWYSAWDWILLCRVASRTGKLLDLPRHWPQRCGDLAQSQDENPHTYSFQRNTDDAHNALSDARWTKRLYDHIYRRQLS